MRLRDFTYYPDIACRVVLMRPYEWIGNEVQCIHRSIPQQIWFYFASANVTYQILGMTVYLWLAEPEKEFSAYLQRLCETLSIFGFAVIKTCNIWTLMNHRGDIETLLAELEQFFPRHESKHYRTKLYHARSTRHMKHFTQLILSALVVYNLEPFSKMVYELSFKSQKIQYKFQSNTWYPWQTLAAPDSFASFAASYLFQLAYSLVGVAYLMAGQCWLCFFITQMELHFDALAGHLLNLDARQPGANDQLKELISYHDRLLRITHQINHIFNNFFLLSFTTATIGICMIACTAVMVNELIPTLKFFEGLLAYLGILFFICFNGTKLTKATAKIMPAAFYNNWYQGDAAYRKMILFMIMQSYESRALRVYNYTPVSMDTYMDILKLSYKMFTFFRSLLE